jgi:hypothetical protein
MPELASLHHTNAGKFYQASGKIPGSRTSRRPLPHELLGLCTEIPVDSAMAHLLLQKTLCSLIPRVGAFGQR